MGSKDGPEHARMEGGGVGVGWGGVGVGWGDSSQAPSLPRLHPGQHSHSSFFLSFLHRGAWEYCESWLSPTLSPWLCCVAKLAWVSPLPPRPPSPSALGMAGVEWGARAPRALPLARCPRAGGVLLLPAVPAGME